MINGLIMIVDDEAGVRDLLTDALRLSNFETIDAKDGMSALTLLRKHTPDLLIIDINMPLMDGFELLERLRESGDTTPAIMLTALGDKQDVSKGLRLGADDYVTKPFGLEELILRVQAILRRAKPQVPGALLLSCGPISLNEESYEVLFNSEVVELSKTEFKLLQHLLENKGRVISKSSLLSAVWEIDFETDSSVVDTYISYLRKKFHKDGFEGIKTIRGVGFQIVEPKKSA